MTALDAFSSRARAAGRFGIDTEFVGEGRYRTLLCLIQLVVSDDESLEVLVLDALDEHLDLAPLAALLADPAIAVVVHAGRQDVALLRRCAATEVSSLFDTQVAAGFAGLSAQAGYDTLLREMLGVRVQKTASYTRWDRRPLDDEQLAYAREDVLHLLELAGSLERHLGASGRLAWALEECRALEQVADTRDVDVIFGRLPRINSLSGAARAVARELVRWREELAERQDRPVTTVLNDAALVEIAKRAPRTPGRAGADPGGQPGQPPPPRRGAACDDRARRDAARRSAAETSHHEAAVSTDGPQIALAEAFVRARALEAGLAYELIAARADLAATVASVRTGRPAPDVRTLTGESASGTGRSGSPRAAARGAQRGGRARRPAVGVERRLRLAACVNREARWCRSATARRSARCSRPVTSFRPVTSYRGSVSPACSAPTAQSTRGSRRGRGWRAQSRRTPRRCVRGPSATAVGVRVAADRASASRDLRRARRSRCRRSRRQGSSQPQGVAHGSGAVRARTGDHGLPHLHIIASPVDQC